MYKTCGHTLKLWDSLVSFKYIHKSRCEYVVNVNKFPAYFNARQSSTIEPHYNQNKAKYSNKSKLMAEVRDKWIELGKYSVFPWSIAGVETCVVVHGENLNVAFDMGYSVRESVNCKDVFIRSAISCCYLFIKMLKWITKVSKITSMTLRFKDDKRSKISRSRNVIQTMVSPDMTLSIITPYDHIDVSNFSPIH